MALAESFSPRSWQAQIIGDPNLNIPEDGSKYKVIVAHRKAGKSMLALMWLFMQAWRCQDALSGKAVRVPRFTYIGPTYAQAKDIAWDLLKSIVPTNMLLRKPNETQMEIRLTNRVIMNIKGADNVGSLRGPGLYGALLDEVDLMPREIWEAVIQPELASTGGSAMFIGTFNGRGLLYDLYKFGRDGQRDWKAWLLPASKPTLNFLPDTPRGDQILSPGFLETVQKETSQKFFEQEYECVPLENAGMVFDRIDQNVIDEYREFPEVGHRYRIGLDVALREDWTVISVLDLTDWKFKYIYRTNKTDAELILSRIQLESNRWTTNTGRPEIMMDTTGMGDPMYETLTAKGLNITPIKFGQKNKMEMVKSLALKFNKDEIRIPRYDWLIDELKDYSYIKLPSGRYRYGAPPGKHDDGVVSLMLACWQLPPKQPVRLPFSNQPQGIWNEFTGIAH